MVKIMKKIFIPLFLAICAFNAPAWAIDELPSCVDSHIVYSGYAQPSTSTFPGLTSVWNPTNDSNCNEKWYVVTVTGASGYFGIKNCVSCNNGTSPYQVDGIDGLSLDGSNSCNFPYMTCSPATASRCSSDGDCSGDTPYCNTSSGDCVECLTDSHCGTTTYHNVVAWTNLTTPACGPNKAVIQRHTCSSNSCSTSYYASCQANYYATLKPEEDWSSSYNQIKVEGTCTKCSIELPNSVLRMLGTFDCTACPGDGQNTPAWRLSDMDIESCCVPANTTGSNTAGSFKYTQECCYSL